MEMSVPIADGIRVKHLGGIGYGEDGEDHDSFSGGALKPNIQNEEALRSIKTLLREEMNWTDTREGRDFWEDVYNRLHRILTKGR
jgi:hypothetical protein